MLFFMAAQGSSKGNIVFNISPTGYPPYMIKSEIGQTKGIIFDVLKAIANKQGYQVVVVGVPKNREVIQLASGDLDANALAIEWVKHPEDFVFSDVIVPARDVLFSARNAPLKFDKLQDLYGKTIGIHLGYSYPYLIKSFNKGLIIASEATTEQAMLGKVLAERTQGAVVNELVGHWLIKNTPRWHGKFVVSKKEIGGFDYRIQFSKKWQEFVIHFNKELKAMKKDGRLLAVKALYR
jgi:polar amino acid transport system substrate-binding protein